jgi:hypothetical protein
VNYARFYLFEPVRFSADVNDSFDPYMSSPQQPNGLLAAGLSLRIRAFRTEMEFVFTQPFAVCLYAGDAPTAVEALRRDLILFSRMLVDPWQINPTLRIGYIRRNKVKFLRINIGRIPKRFHMARQ